MKKKLILNTLLYTILPKLPTLASFFILPFITPYLTLGDYGRFGLVTACYSAFSLFVVLGQNIVLQNSFFEYHKHYNLVWSRVYGVMTASSVGIAFLLAILFYFFLGRTFSSEFFIVSALFGIALICSPIDTIAQVFYILNEKPLPLVIRSILMGTINALVVFISIRYLKLGYLGWVIGIACNGLFSLLFYLYPICFKKKIYPHFCIKKKHIIEYMKVGLPLLPHTLSIYIFNTSDRLLLSFFNISIKEIGLYSQSYSLGSNGMTLIDGLFSALSRTLQESFRNRTENNRQKLRKLFAMVVFGVGIILFNCALWMKEVFLFLFRKPELQIGYPVAMVIITGYIYFPLYDFAMYPLFIKKKTNLIARISISAALVNLVGNIIFIPIYGYWAALVSTYVSFIFFALSALLFRDTRSDLNWMFPRSILTYSLSVVCILLITIIVWFFKDVYWPYKVVATFFSFLTTFAFSLYLGLFKINKSVRSN